MRFSFISPVSVEPWSFESSDNVGGNEQGIIQMSRRLSRRGHQVSVYCDTPWESGIREHEGVVWSPLVETDITGPGVWVLCRCPEVADQFSHDHPDQKLWLLVQDFDHEWGASYFDKIDRVLFTCKTHRRLVTAKHPNLRAGFTDNGVQTELIERLEPTIGKRDLFKIMFASSPDRGLRNLIHLFRRARERVPELSLHVFYGFNNIEAIIAREGSWPTMEREKAMIGKLARETLGVHMHGRVTQEELYRHWLTSGFWLCPTMFREMSSVTAKEAQCCGAVPIATPVWGVGDNCLHGTFIMGNPDEEMNRCRFSGELVRMASNLGRLEQLRVEMMAESRDRCNWERRVTDWEEMARQ